jgi:aminoglycoside phosphotransferase (APT) family kinase protein
MRILETIAKTLKAMHAHPTTVLNALIELENTQGIHALEELEYRVARLVRSYDRSDPQRQLAQAWLEATRAYLEEHGQLAPIRMKKSNFDTQVIELLSLKAS